jgi:hypothetical protein
MPDPVVEFFTEKEWYDQDEISMNKRLAVREFYEWLQRRPTMREPDASPVCICPADGLSLLCPIHRQPGRGLR